MERRRARLSMYLVPIVLLSALALGGVAFFLGAQQALTGNLWGVPLDDAYIHFRFAQNLAAGHGFSFNPGQPVPGSTSPLWVLLLAAAGLAGVPLWLAAKVLGVLFLVIGAVLAWRLALRLGYAPVAALAAGVLAALDARLLWAAPSGMEVTLFAALCLAAFLARPQADAGAAMVGRRLLLVAALCGLATLTRPEGYLLALVLGIDLYRRFRPPSGPAALAVALYVALVLPYNLFALATTGHLLPTTFYAKANGLGPWTLPLAVQYVVVLAYYLFATNAALPILAPVGAVALWRRGGEVRAVVAWPVMLVLFQALFSPLLYHFGRYTMPLDPFFALLAVVGITRLTRPAQGASSWTVALPPLALVAVGLFSLSFWANLYAYSVQNIDAMHVVLGGWVRAHVPRGMPVALNDVGAISYISDHPAVDIEGLISPRFITLKREQPLSRRAHDMYAAIKQSGARYMIIFPEVYPWLASEPGLRRVYSVTLSHPVIVPHTGPRVSMVVYRIAG